MNAKRKQQAIKKALAWGLLRTLGRAKGFDRDSLQRVGGYLDASLGLRAPHYTHTLQKPRHYFPGLTAQPWHDPAQFPWARQLERAQATIKSELAAIRQHVRPHHEGLADGGDWNVYYFYYLGHKVEENCARCPCTTRIINSIPTLTNTGLVYFSVLTPATHITPHCGPINTRLRCHLGIDVPSGCRIWVGSETRAWEEGKCLVFDDSFEHEVWHSGNTTRTVLILDVWHPDLTEAEVWAMSRISRMSTGARRFARSVRKNLQEYE